MAYGCIKYADLCQVRTSEYEFSYDKMLSDKGNTAVYMLYAYTRIQSILRQPVLAEHNVDLDKEAAEHDISIKHERVRCLEGWYRNDRERM